MEELIILGAGPHAHEMADMVRWVNGVQGDRWELLGFLVPEGEAGRVGERSEQGDVVLGTYAALARYPGARLLPEVNSDAPDLPAERLATLVAPSAFVTSTARIGPGSVIYPNCFVGHHADLGARTFALSGCVINHDVRLADDVILASGVTIAGFVRVEAGCYLGQASTIRQHLRIGRGSLIGMGSVVIRDVPPNSVMVGNPARRLRDRAEG